MPRRPPLARNIAITARWPVGVGLTSWRYMWRTTPMYRHEEGGALSEDSPPRLPEGADLTEVQQADDGVGPLFHRRYRARIADARLSPEELVREVSADPNRVTPRDLANFSKVRGEGGRMRVGDEYVVRMPGPWDGPVRVVELTDGSFRLATLEGHLEAGQIEFRAERDGDLTFTIESWARSGDRLCDILYDRLRMAKEVQLHMWISFLEKVIGLSGGRRKGGLRIHTRRVD